MAQEKSAIMQMILGNRGNFECMRMSEEYRKAQRELYSKVEELEKQLKDSPDLLKLFNELMDASLHESAIYGEDVYIEAFSFGLAIGQEVVSK